MIEKLEDGVYRIHKRDIRENMTAAFDELCKVIGDDFSYRLVTSRNDTRLNGHSAYVKYSDNDFRSFALILVH